MLDVKAIRRDPEPVLSALARRGDGSDERLRGVLELDERRRRILPEVEGLRARQNEAGGSIARAKGAGQDASEAIAALQEVKRAREALEQELAAVDADYDAALLTLPNPPDPSAADEDTDLRVVGEAVMPSHPPRYHLELAGRMIDM